MNQARGRRGARLGATVSVVVVLLVIGAVVITGIVAALRWGDAHIASGRCSAGGHWLEADQTANAALIVGTTLRRDLPARAGTIGIATAMQESRMRPIDYGDRDSLGMFQQRPSQGWGTPEQVQDPVYATETFFDHLVRVPDYTELEVTVAAQAVQRSAFPDAYAQHEDLARAFASALTGWSPAALTCDLDPVSHQDEEATESVAQEAATLLARDLGLEGQVTADLLRVDATSLPGADGDAGRAAWAVAAWAVATAPVTAVGTVQVADRAWHRGEEGWQEVPGEPVPAGTVRIGA
ncbi:hypothetical protein [Serinibacter salmoneus]|uniref:Uncharacterized protein n=1 Tax=Serinibacter salmoneus TaxID=556530 RepID=A0A2A9D2B4_9MICO|nr:hypothetical protein [Serinibacter salmoneus]PFG20385.1 hypothetical protein ATL40_1983 [Serinibacter salmoneus]